MQIATLIRPNEKFETHVVPFFREGYRRFVNRHPIVLNKKEHSSKCLHVHAVNTN